jgi:ATP adenylyltransferase
LERIWAPWRIEYIKQPDKNKRCFICDMIKEEHKEDKKNLLLYRGKHSVVLLNKYPYISGHLMVAPIKHTNELSAISSETSKEMWRLTTQSVEVLREAIQPQGFNIGINLGEVAGAGLKTHLHIHIVPRWIGDTNFLPVLSNTRAIAQALEETYETLKEHVELLKPGEKNNRC